MFEDFNAVAQPTLPGERPLSPIAAFRSSNAASQEFRLKPLHKLQQIGVIDFLRRIDSALSRS